MCHLRHGYEAYDAQAIGGYIEPFPPPLFFLFCLSNEIYTYLKRKYVFLNVAVHGSSFSLQRDRVLHCCIEMNQQKGVNKITLMWTKE